MLHLEDESVDVVCNTLKIMCRCYDGYIAPILPHTESKNRRIRAGALAVLTRHDLDDTERWFERGLKDPEVCVRMEVARLLPTLDRIAYQGLFDIARHDPTLSSNVSLKSDIKLEKVIVILFLMIDYAFVAQTFSLCHTIAFHK